MDVHITDHVICGPCYTGYLIKSFKDASTMEVAVVGSNRWWTAIAGVAKRKLDMIEAATNLADLRVPPANRLQSLKGDRKGQHSIRINDQYRICFIWKEDGAYEAEITAYH